MSDAPVPPAVAIDHPRGRTMLKWHRGRAFRGDMEFDPRRILQGMALGASVEIDLTRHRGGGFAVLHDEALDRATTGTGLVAETEAAALRGLFLRDNAGRPSAAPVALLADLCARIAATRIAPGAVLQLDMKDGDAILTEADVAAFARDVRPVARHMILSGGDARAVTRLSAALPDLAVGHDPCHFGKAEALAASGDDAGFVAGALAEQPAARMIYLEIPLILGAARRGFDMIAAFHAAGKRIDAYTVNAVTADTVEACRALMARGVDQITTDDAAGLYAAFAG